MLARAAGGGWVPPQWSGEGSIPDPLANLWDMVPLFPFGEKIAKGKRS